MDCYFKSSHQQVKHSKQNKQQSKKNNLPDLQEDHIVVFDDISFELIPMQSENLLNKNLILSKCCKVEKKVQNQIFSNNIINVILGLNVSNSKRKRVMGEERRKREEEEEGEGKEQN
ncbi:unnamed protein product [Rhizophagus irregularis]|uniref:Uncharacterized protein n=1 Tax=Rhizophagus irregularis TaxID=588596 RepID=A0A2N1M6S9_9GLOM|nr:hypothetical protein RhiirC2_798196 [Rhizophagus irregularis]CAB4391753.1 unnamed protein product [Rhizophagus irregularis]